MTSYRQIEANRRNAHKSTGPKTEAGKEASRRNGVRHGLTAETVIGALEDAEDYKAFEAAITADYMHNRRSSANSCYDWRAFCGGCAARRQWKPACSTFKPNSCVTTGKTPNDCPILLMLFTSSSGGPIPSTAIQLRPMP
jgi:hypothetical protein